MSFSRGPKKSVPEVETNVWACTSESCAGWMRESFSFSEEPECPLCQSSMELETRVLPEVED
ncbi:cold-shock protein [Lentibacillus salinarum]|uniref:Cold-shock protein n=1 Tax=Lentibacillus salinarum TaxID=446820 RepID=A0ABW3ZVJ3_9BACI